MISEINRRTQQKEERKELPKDLGEQVDTVLPVNMKRKGLD